MTSEEFVRKWLAYLTEDDAEKCRSEMAADLAALLQGEREHFMEIDLEQVEKRHREGKASEGSLGHCYECHQPYPCDAIQLAQALREAQAEYKSLFILNQTVWIEMRKAQRERDALQRRLAEAEAEVARLRGKFQHRFNNGVGPVQDWCAECGWNLRDEIHIRIATDQAALGRG